MTMLRTRRWCLHALAGLGGTALGGCAAILHPERRGNSSGPIDVGPLILDILWFIPGLVPGIVALAVDFGTGAIYLGGGRSSKQRGPRRLAIAPGEPIVVRAPRPDEDADVALRLVGPRGEVLDEARGRWSAGEHDDELRVALAPSQRDALDDVRLELAVTRAGRTSVAAHPLCLRARRA
jgi:hypothetical protein